MPDLTSFWISFRATLISIMIVTISGILISKWLCNKKRYWVNLLGSFIILPTVLPPTVLGFILLVIFSTRSPVGEFFTNILHLPAAFTLTGAMIASVIVSSPLMYQHTVNDFRSIDSKMLNTARAMGVSETKIFLKLVLPLPKHSIFAGITTSFARAIGEFSATSMVAGYTPGETNILPLEIYFPVEQGKENETWLWVLVLVAFAVAAIVTINLVNRDTFREID